MYERSYASGTSDMPLLGLTIGEKFDAIAREFSENEALVVKHQNIKWTYKELALKVNECALALLACGLNKGDRVGIWSPNCSEWTILQFATAKAGIILVNINPSYRKHELQYALVQSGCKMLVLADKFKTSDYSKMILETCPELKEAEFGHLQSKILPELSFVISLSNEPKKGLTSWSHFCNLSNNIDAEELVMRQNTLAFDDPINIQYTSGTTGYPKGATLSHHNILNNGFFVTRTMNFTSEDRLIIPVPLYHCFGMVMGNLGCMAHGATMIYPD